MPPKVRSKKLNNTIELSNPFSASLSIDVQMELLINRKESFWYMLQNTFKDMGELVERENNGKISREIEKEQLWK